jgi:hypothetical protein
MGESELGITGLGYRSSAANHGRAILREIHANNNMFVIDSFCHDSHPRQK